MDYAMFFSGMLVMALIGGLIVILFIRPWLKPARRGWEASQEVVAENSRLAAAQVKRQTAEEQTRANEAAATAEQTRARRIQAQTENDQAEIQHKATLKQDSIRAAIAVEQTRARLIEARAENDKLEIERRAALRRAGIDPDAPPPWKIKRQYIKWAVILAVLFILTTIVSIYFS